MWFCLHVYGMPCGVVQGLCCSIWLCVVGWYSVTWCAGGYNLIVFDLGIHILVVYIGCILVWSV